MPHSDDDILITAGNTAGEGEAYEKAVHRQQKSQESEM